MIFTLYIGFHQTIITLFSIQYRSSYFLLLTLIVFFKLLQGRYKSTSMNGNSSKVKNNNDYLNCHNE